MPRVSVIMNCYNGEAYLRDALDSIYAQTFGDWEIIFWDNASTDDSPAIARSYDARLKYHRADATTPLGAARNGALGLVTGDYIAFLDTDDKWMPAKLERQVALMDANPRLGLTHTDVLCHYQADGTTTRHFALLGEKPARGRVFGYLLKVNAIAMPSAMLRTDALRQQKEWFDERFEIYPDFDLFRRIAHDWECDYVDEPLAFYRVHGASSSTRNHLRAARELAQTLDKLCALYPEMATEYAEEAAYLRAMIVYQTGKSYWRQGDGRAARAEFRKHWDVAKMRQAYWASFLPYGTVERFWRATARLAGRG